MEVFDESTVRLPVVIRTARHDDLRDLEWFGMFRNHRELFEEAWERHRRGGNVMLVADVNGFPGGQVWIDLERGRDRQVGYLWAFRVLPLLQGQGLGGQLLDAAEQVVGRHFPVAEITVEKDNEGAKRLYERRGYEIVGEVQEHYGYTTPDGHRFDHHIEVWVLHKDIWEGE